MKLTWKSCAVQHKDSVHPSDRGVKKEMNGMLSQDREKGFGTGSPGVSRGFLWTYFVNYTKVVVNDIH